MINWHYAGIGAILLVATVLRVAFIDHQGLWHDEVYSLAFLHGVDLYLFEGADLKPYETPKPVSYYTNMFAQGDFWSNLPRNIVHEGHPPIYYFALKGWSVVFGDSAVALRSLSAVASLATVLLVILTIQSIAGHRSALVAGSLLAVSPFQLYFANEARPYALALFFSLVFIWILLHVCYHGTARRLVVVLGVSAALLAAMTHYYAGLFVLASTIVFWHRIPSTAKRPILLLGIIAGLLVALWVPILLQQVAAHSGSHWTEGRVGMVGIFSGVVGTVNDLFTGPLDSASLLESVVVIGTVAVSIAFGIRHLSADHQTLIRRLLIVCLTFEGLIIITDFATDHHTVMVTRYASMMHLLLIIVLAVSLTSLGRLGALFTGLIVIHSIGASVAVGLGIRAPKQDLEAVATYVSTHVQPNEVVYVSPSGPSLAGFALYADRSDLKLGAIPKDQVDSVITNSDFKVDGIWLAIQRLDMQYEQTLQQPPLGRGTWHRRGELVQFTGMDLWHVQH